jgi:hypothetical protein
VLPGEDASDSEDAVRSSRDRARDLGEAVLLPTGSGFAENELAVARNFVRGEHATFFEDDDGRGKLGASRRSALPPPLNGRPPGSLLGSATTKRRGSRMRAAPSRHPPGECAVSPGASWTSPLLANAAPSRT